MNSELKPKIRFKGFTDDWEQRKLSDYATFRRGSFPQPYGKAEWYDGLGSMPFVQVADVGNDMKLVNETKQRISKVAQPMSVFIPKQSVIVTLQGTIGRVAITQYDAYLDRTVLYFDSYKNSINKNFWSYVIKTKFLEEAKSAPGGTIKTITKEVLSNFDLKMPLEVNEQNKIGELFTNLDNLITLHQRKCDKLVELKKSLLEKMFPQNNSVIPEIRFKGFTNDWEQRKLKGLCNIYDGTHQTPNYKDSGIMFLSVENIKNLKSNKYISYDDFKRNFKVYPEKNDILMTRIGDIGTTNIVKENSLKAYYVSLALLKCKSINPYYLNFAMNSNFVQNGLKLRSLLTAIPMKINKDQIGETDIIYPVDFKEQSKIGKVFDNIDNLITLHQCKYDKLNKIRQSLLNDMFI